jgi:hypothetical protein
LEDDLTLLLSLEDLLARVSQTTKVMDNGLGGEMSDLLMQIYGEL